MNYRAYKMRLKKEYVSDYRQIHRKEKIWPEITQCLLKSGMERMIIFQDDQNLILFEEAENLDESYAIQNADEITQKWDVLIGDWMERYPVFNGIEASDIDFEEIDIVFYFEKGKLKH